MIPSGRSNDTTQYIQTMDKIALILLLGMVGLAVYRRVRSVSHSLRSQFEQGKENV